MTTGALKEQLDRLVEKFFRNLQSDEMLNFSVAVTVGRVQRKWRARMRAAKLMRKKAWRNARRVSAGCSNQMACSIQGPLP